MRLAAFALIGAVLALDGCGGSSKPRPPFTYRDPGLGQIASICNKLRTNVARFEPHGTGKLTDARLKHGLELVAHNGPPLVSATIVEVGAVNSPPPPVLSCVLC